MRRKVLSLALVIIYAASILLGLLGPMMTVQAEGGPVIKLHYLREDGNYDGWDVWFWAEGKDGAAIPFAEEDGEMVATFEAAPGTMKVGYIVRTADWEKDVNMDQFIDVSEVVSGTVHAYVKSQVEGCTKEYGADCVIGVKLKSATYDGDKKIVVKMTSEIEGDFESAFTLASKTKEIKITDIVAGADGEYQLTIEETLDPFRSCFITFEESEYKVIMPNVYSSKEFEDEFTYEGDDLGFTYSPEKTSFKVWAPTADSVVLKCYQEGSLTDTDVIHEVEMTKGEKGTWFCEVEGDLNGTYYVYSVSVDGNKKAAMDPYAKSAGVNGVRSMVLDLDATDPDGWDKDENPFAGKSITDAVIYEAHVRDLTVGADNGIVNQGKFLGMVETGTKTSTGVATGLDHIKDLGVTHVQILPMYDFGSVDESKSFGYNWGYDPVNYNVPEGSYATDANDGAVRVKEAKEMVKGFHDNGIAVVMDVVYNHVYNANNFCINQIVPGYFSRVNDEGIYANGSGCGNDTATERAMVKKYIVDSVNYWADEYHIDGFRFDLVGLMDTELINEIVATVHEKHPDVIFYGEGWTLNTAVTKDGVTLATQPNSVLTPDFGYFNDSIRDGLKGSVFNTETGFVSGAPGLESLVADCFMGNDTWCKSPTQSINYVSCHDNNTLYDRLRLSNPDASNDEIIRMNNLSAAVYMLAEGVPFFQAGEEMLRTKTNEDGTFNSNSFSSGDAVNIIDWTALDNEEGKAVYDYYKGLIEFRKAHSTLRLTDANKVEEAFKEVKTDEPQLLTFMIEGQDKDSDMFVVFNASEEAKEITLPEGKWSVCINESVAGAKEITSVSKTTTVAPVSALVLVKKQSSVAKVFIALTAVLCLGAGGSFAVKKAFAKKKDESVEK